MSREQRPLQELALGLVHDDRPRRGVGRPSINREWATSRALYVAVKKLRSRQTYSRDEPALKEILRCLNSLVAGLNDPEKYTALSVVESLEARYPGIRELLLALVVDRGEDVGGGERYFVDTDYVLHGGNSPMSTWNHVANTKGVRTPKWLNQSDGNLKGIADSQLDDIES